MRSQYALSKAKQVDMTRKAINFCLDRLLALQGYQSDAFGSVEDALWDSSLLDLFQGVREGIPGQGSPTFQ